MLDNEHAHKNSYFKQFLSIIIFLNCQKALLAFTENVFFPNEWIKLEFRLNVSAHQHSLSGSILIRSTKRVEVEVEEYSGPKLLAFKVYSVIFPFTPIWGDEGVIYRSQLFDPMDNDLTFHSRQYLARYDETLKLYGVLSKIHHFSIGRKSQLQPPIKNIWSFLHRCFLESDAVLVALRDGNLKWGLVLLLNGLEILRNSTPVCNLREIRNPSGIIKN